VAVWEGQSIVGLAALVSAQVFARDDLFVELALISGLVFGF
jgi:hypothetical protein